MQGVLDLLANRCLAQGTNAWTDVDHTCYTVTTAGSEGFLNLLPVYLDHILYPTLTVSLLPPGQAGVVWKDTTTARSSADTEGIVPAPL